MRSEGPEIYAPVREGHAAVSNAFQALTKARGLRQEDAKGLALAVDADGNAVTLAAARTEGFHQEFLPGNAVLDPTEAAAGAILPPEVELMILFAIIVKCRRGGGRLQVNVFVNALWRVRLDGSARAVIVRTRDGNREIPSTKELEALGITDTVAQTPAQPAPALATAFRAEPVDAREAAEPVKHAELDDFAHLFDDLPGDEVDDMMLYPQDFWDMIASA